MLTTRLKRTASCIVPAAINRLFRHLSCSQVMCLMMLSCVVILVNIRIKIYCNDAEYSGLGNYIPGDKKSMLMRRSMFIRKNEHNIGKIIQTSYVQQAKVEPIAKPREVISIKKRTTNVTFAKPSYMSRLFTTLSTSVIATNSNRNVPKNPLKSSQRIVKRQTNQVPAINRTIEPMKYFKLIRTFRCLKPYFLIVYVHCAPLHYSHRMYIRETWGNSSKYDSLVKVVFMIGKSQLQGINDAVVLESERHGDIVFADYMDSYRNLTYKAVTSLGWVNQACNNTKFVLKVDDDVFVNLFKLIRHLKTLETKNASRDKILMCFLWGKMIVVRDKKSKWYVSESEYPGKHFLRYCSGTAWILTQSTVRELYQASSRNGFFWVDDVYVTGILGRYIGVKHVKINRMVDFHWKSYLDKMKAKQVNPIIFVLTPSFRMWGTLWKSVMDDENVTQQTRIRKSTANSTL